MAERKEITREDVSPEFLERRPGFRASRGVEHTEVAKQREADEWWEAKKAAHLAEQRKGRRRQYQRSLYHEPQTSWGDHLGDVSDDWVPRYLAASQREQLRSEEEAAARFSLERQEWIPRSEEEGLGEAGLDYDGEVYTAAWLAEQMDKQGAAGTADLDAAWRDYNRGVQEHWNEALDRMRHEGLTETEALKELFEGDQDTGPVAQDWVKSRLAAGVIGSALESGESPTEAQELQDLLDLAGEGDVSKRPLGGGRYEITVDNEDPDKRGSFIYDANQDSIYTF